MKSDGRWYRQPVVRVTTWIVTLGIVAIGVVVGLARIDALGHAGEYGRRDANIIAATVGFVAVVFVAAVLVCVPFVGAILARAQVKHLQDKYPSALVTSIGDVQYPIPTDGSPWGWESPSAGIRFMVVEPTKLSLWRGMVTLQKIGSVPSSDVIRIFRRNAEVSQLKYSAVCIEISDCQEFLQYSILLTKRRTPRRATQDLVENHIQKLQQLMTKND